LTSSSPTVRSSAASAGARVILMAAASIAASVVALSAFAACSTDVDLGGGADAGASLPGPTLEDLGDICEPCTTSATCPTSAVCVQIAGKLTFCATVCPNATECESDETCQLLATGQGATTVRACAPAAGLCAPAPPPASEGGALEHCGSLESPTTVAACRSCDKDDKDCQPNGCYGGWWCNTTSNRCRKPPATCP
jgi:hypothetical protein